MTISGCKLIGYNTTVNLVGSLYTRSIAVGPFSQSYSQAVPSGAIGNLLLLIIVSPGGITLPSGWTQLTSQANANLLTLVCYKSASTTSESNFTVSISGQSNCGTAMYRFSGASTSLVAGAVGAFNTGTNTTVNYQAISGGLSTDYYIQWSHATNASASFSIPTTSIDALLVDNDVDAPSFTSFFSIGDGSAKSSNITQPTTNPVASGQIRIPAL